VSRVIVSQVVIVIHFFRAGVGYKMCGENYGGLFSCAIVMGYAQPF
jgi:hypothetical protein